MSAILWLAFAFSSDLTVRPGEACRPCHTAIVESYQKTGMGRSITVRPTPPSGTFYHRRSNRHYTISANTMRRHQTSADQSEVNVIAKTIDLAIGSGNHAITFASRTPQGRLLELPLSWYAQPRAWAMSPGYDRADHEDFRREIADSCLFCHSTGATPAPIDCSRCHGLPDAHLKAPVKGSILNPARLDPQRQLDVCLQCHLQTASAGIQDSVRRPGKDTWSFQPGMALGDYKMLFDRADGEDRLEINHAGYRLMQSACFRKSRGTLVCTTCHSPHTAAVRENACEQCHATAHAGNRAAVAGSSCASCHMPKRVPSDVVHAVITDHKIVRTARFENPREEDHRPYGGKIEPFYVPADELTQAAVSKRMTGSDEIALYRKLVTRDARNAILRTTLGKLLLRSGRGSEAITEFRKALEIDPQQTDARCHLGVAEALLGRHQQALVELRRAVAENPDHSLSWINLGITLQVVGETAKARDAFTEAIRLQPDSSEARRRLAELRLRQ